MNVNEIYKNFYETHIRKEDTKADTCRDRVMKFLATKDLTADELSWMDTMLGAISCYSEEQGFLDGFAEGIDHIAGALTFAKTRLQE